MCVPTMVQELVMAWDLSGELYCRGGQSQLPAWCCKQVSSCECLRPFLGSTCKQKPDHCHPGYFSMGLCHWQVGARTRGQVGRSE